VLFDAKDPAGAVNRRISIIVMNREAEERLLRIASDEEENTPAIDAALSTSPPAAR
jgi:chemotaxis protein MotB